MKTKQKVLTGVLAGALTASVALTTMFLPTEQVYAEYSVDFSQGDYSIWDGTSYTFSWYETPVIEDGVTTYTISSASDLAGLCVLTNNLSASEFSSITSNIAAEDASYIASVDSFEGKTIKLACDIDLADFDWMPISYPWDTANLTAQYEFTNTDGNIVKYNAVDHIPDDTVDPWVGDENGNPISTRYWEYPESELRFRDLTKTITGFGAHDTYQDSVKKDVTPFMMYSSAGHEHTAMKTINLPVTAVKHQNFDETDIIDCYGFKNIVSYTSNPGFSGLFDGGEHKIKGLCPSTPWTDDTTERLTTYDPIAKGLFGMVSEKGILKDINVKGSYDDEIVSYSALLCAWNYGIINHCYVDGYMKQSLIEMIYPVNRDYGPNGTSTYVLSDTAGTVMPVGNSGFLTSQNYGKIIDSYTVGEVVQAFRQFGFAASSNYGKIINCENRAFFSTQPVETDFITDEWDYNLDTVSDVMVTDTVYIYGTMGQYSGLNPRTVDYPSNSILSVAYDKGHFKWLNTLTVILGRNSYNFSGVKLEYMDNPYFGLENTKPDVDYAHIICSDDLHPYSSNLIYAAPATYAFLDDGWYDDFSGIYAQSNIESIMSATGLNTTCLHTTNYMDAGYALSVDSFTSDMWIPEQYNTGDGESIAANHLYGVYQQTVVGGIAAVNYDTITDCRNMGTIESMYNTSPRNNFDTENTLSVAYNPTRHSYSYIRPNNSYSMFVTATNTHTVAGGLVGINMGIVGGVNTGIINKRLETVQERIATFEGKRNDMISATQNGFYQNGVRYDLEVAVSYLAQWGEDDMKTPTINGRAYTNWGFGWYITEDNLSENLVACSDDCGLQYTVDLFDRNMPYPYVIRENCKLYQSVAGICAVNSNKIINAEHTGYADYGVCKLSIGTTDDASLDTVSVNITTDEDTPISGAVFGIAVDTDIKHARSTVSAESDFDVPTATGNILRGVARRPVADDIVVYTGVGSFGNICNVDIENVVIYDCINEGEGVCITGVDSSMTNIYNYQNSKSACGNLTGRNDLTDIYAFGDNRYAFVEGDINGIWQNLNYYGPHCYYVFDTRKQSDAENAKIEKVRIYPLTNDSLGTTDAGLCLYNIELFDVDMFIACNVEMLKAYTCKVENVNIYGNTQHIEDSTSNVIAFDNCTVKDFLSQIYVDIEVKNYRETFQMQSLPGVLKAQRDTNTFENVVIMTPAGLASYPTINSADDIDMTILSDASLVNDKNARTSGALAYYMDKGTRLDRTYRWTVTDDMMVSILPDDCIVDKALLFNIPDTITLPEHTRKLDNEDRSKAFYRFNIPNSAAGFGEIIGTSVRGNLTQYTSLAGLYEQTSLFLHEGEEVALSVTTDPTHALIGMTRATLQKTEEIPSEDKPTAAYKHTSEVMPAYDVELIGVWSGVHTIEVDSDIGTWISITPNVYGAALGQTVELEGFLQDTDVLLTDIYYCEYKLDNNNKFVLDRENKHSIDMSTLSFVMPDANIQISASCVSDSTDISRFVLAGVDGTIDGSDITVQLNSSIDISNIAPDMISIPYGATVTPGVNEPQNFLNEVKYVVKAQGGKTATYFVKVVPVADGKITRFNVLGFEAVITDDNVIQLTVPTELDVTSVTPLIVWSGISITPDLSTPMDLTMDDLTFTVEGSDSVQNVYTFELIRDEHADEPVEITLIVDDTPLSLDIDYDNHVISVAYPFGVDVSRVRLEGSNIVETEDILDGSYLNLTKHNNIVLRAPDNSTSIFEVIAVELKDDRKEITQFTLFGYNGVINNENHTITVELPIRYDVTNIAPDVIGYLGREISDLGAKKDFTQTVEYTVTAYDESCVTYTITVLRIS